MTKNVSKDDVKGSVAAALAELLQPKGIVNWDKADPDIKYEGKQIALPNDPGKMEIQTAIDILERKLEDENTVMDISETIDAFPLDGGVAFVKAMKKLYGWASPTPVMSFFGPIPPDLITVQIGPEDEPNAWTQVPWGQFTIPGIENPINIGAKKTPTGPVFVAYGQVKKKEQGILRELADEARAILKAESIYKGKAIRLKANNDGVLDTENPPTFLSTRYINRNDLILNEDEAMQVQASIWTPIQQTELCRKYGIPLKRGVLLEGIYGIGKTMIATATSQVCVENGWTYILLDDVRAMKDALLFAKRYAPAVIFAEDAERVAGSRDKAGNDLLNVIDGVLSKNSEVMTVFTTNHVEKIERAMLRPGRLDAVISVRAPEPDAVVRLINLYARGRIADGENLAIVGNELAGQIPATIREVVERAKLGMIGRQAEVLSAEDLLTSARSMKRHLELLNIKPVIITPEQELASGLRKVIASAVGGEGAKDVLAGIKSVENTLVNNVLGNMLSVKELVSTMQRGSKHLDEKLTGINDGVKKIVNYHDL
jgi:transitional endoplasmic reticulum ATPase